MQGFQCQGILMGGNNRFMGCDTSGSDAFSTFGFRGEALSAICAMGDMTIATKTANESAAARFVISELRRHPPFAAIAVFRSMLWASCLECVRN